MNRINNIIFNIALAMLEISLNIVNHTKSPDKNQFFVAEEGNWEDVNLDELTA